MSAGRNCSYAPLRAWASRSSSAMYASSASTLTRHTPRLPIFTAGSCPDRISVYTCETVTFRTSATSAGWRKRGRSATNPASGCVAMRAGTAVIVPAAAKSRADGRVDSRRP